MAGWFLTEIGLVNCTEVDAGKAQRQDKGLKDKVNAGPESGFQVFFIFSLSSFILLYVRIIFSNYRYDN